MIWITRGEITNSDYQSCEKINNSEITPEDVFLRRRELLKAAGLSLGATTAAMVPGVGFTASEGASGQKIDNLTELSLIHISEPTRPY